MIVFKMVKCVAISLLALLLFCDKYSTFVEAKENVNFVDAFIQPYYQEEKKDIHPSPFINLWERVNILSDAVKDKEIHEAEKSLRREDENRIMNSVQNIKRITRQINHGYSSIYPALTTPYPSVQFNPSPYRQPAGQQYGAAQHTSNFSNYPVYQNVNNSTVSYRRTFQNTTFNYPPHNGVSFRPTHSPGQNLFYGNASTINKNLAPRPYNQSRSMYPNTTFSPQNNWSSKPNYFNYNNQITNQTVKNPQYNPLGNLILNGYGANYTHHNLNPVTGRVSFYSQNTTQTAPWLNKTTSSIPAYDRNYPSYNTFNQRTNHTINNYQHNLLGSALNGSRLNYPSYITTSTVRNNYTSGLYQWTRTNSHNTTHFNIPSHPQKGSWPNSTIPMNPMYNQNNSINRGNQNQWSYNNSIDHSVNKNRNPSYNNGSQSSWPSYPVTNSNHSQQLPYLATNYPMKTDSQNDTRYNNIPKQNHNMEPNHFFYTPGYNLSYYDLRKDSAQKFSYA